MSTLTGAVVEVAATLAFMALCGTAVGLFAVMVARMLPERVRDWLRREWSNDDLPPVRRGHESPVEVFRRKQLERANEWQQVDR